MDYCNTEAPKKLKQTKIPQATPIPMLLTTMYVRDPTLEQGNSSCTSLAIFITLQKNENIFCNTLSQMVINKFSI